MDQRRSRRVLSAVVFLLGCGCGGLPAEQAPLPDPKQTELTSTAAMDGVVLSDGTVDTTGAMRFTGDLDGDENGLGARQFWSFDLHALPPGSTVLGAVVAFQQMDRVGTPYNTHGPVVFDRVDYGDSLDASDYDTSSLEEIGALLANNPSSFTTGFGISIDETVLLAAYESPEKRLQFRVRFQDMDSDTDGVSDYTVWGDGEIYPGIMGPTLTVVFRPPPTP